ncbi:hypothetical protein MAMC_00080 [Methylacidimicrobium cyclopophantes]|uniref:Uncharacterized protein n=1 Tax=Methylacidimicrobium cyclopophantes TaxID=1041766 RepID=A0A5E6M9U8_9BACT|nr:hypothetical protein MAMC_00080 [Methylacidimicrobium cyclopophantes]
MRCALLAILLLGIPFSQELFAGLVQTSKGTRLSILERSLPEDPKKEAGGKMVAESGGKDKTTPIAVAKNGAPKGRVKIRSIASSRVKNRERSPAAADAVASRDKSRPQPRVARP